MPHLCRLGTCAVPVQGPIGQPWTVARAPVQEWSSRQYRASRRFKRAARSLGLRIRTLRERQGLTLEKAAEAADLDLTHWQKAEAGKVNLTLVTLLRISDGLGVSLEELFYARDGNQPEHGRRLKGARGHRRGQSRGGQAEP